MVQTSQSLYYHVTSCLGPRQLSRYTEQLQDGWPGFDYCLHRFEIDSGAHLAPIKGAPRGVKLTTDVMHNSLGTRTTVRLAVQVVSHT
jgi:hypothetical protein